LFRAFKTHPLIRAELEGGKVVGYGAKVLPEGGLHSIPTLVTDGALIVGDAAGLLDSVRLKGVHGAVQSGIAAGDALFECARGGDWSVERLRRYPARLAETQVWKDLRKVRNVRAAFRYGVPTGVAATGLSLLTGGALPAGRLGRHADHLGMQPLGAVKPPPGTTGLAKDSQLQMDRLTDLFYSGTAHEEHQPAHLHILDPRRCAEECIPKYGAPCTRFCPAEVYELDAATRSIRINASNCLHCKTCQIKDPLANIEWVPPEGGGGPRYRQM
jgi:electron-transferring-flavoprotein dehydrogenase